MKKQILTLLLVTTVSANATSPIDEIKSCFAKNITKHITHEQTKCHRKGKRRFNPSHIFRALADSCFDIAGLVGVLGAGKQLALSGCGYLFTALSQMSRRKRDKHSCPVSPDEEIIGGMTREEFVANLALLMQSMNMMQAGRTKVLVVGDELGLEEKIIALHNSFVDEVVPRRNTSANEKK